jgi:DNA-binding transcriptional MerR regulator
MLTKPAKSHYSEVEVAAELGVSVKELRSLIRMHVIPKEDEIKHTSVLTFQPSDLLLLRLLATQATAPSPQG